MQQPSYSSSNSPTTPTRLSMTRFALSSLVRRFAPLWLGLPALGLVATIVIGAASPANIPKINLAADPLYAAAAGDKATIALALSVEFPTVGAQYVAGSATDATYSNTIEYLGYYDAEACYSYNDAPAETPPSGMTKTDLKRFDRTGDATHRKCADAFSGNFLNWASNSAVDMLRLALSGGDRYVDTPDLTILQRAVVPNGDPICMWNTGNFPAKRVQRNGGGTNAYWGAVPQAMITSAGGNDIWVANTLNRIYFTAIKHPTDANLPPSSSCSNTTPYRLTTSGSSIGPITPTSFTTGTAVAQFGGIQCASEGGTCSFNGKMEVLYGAPPTSGRAGGWMTFLAANGAACTNTVTGTMVDPAPGIAKTCHIRPYTGTNTWTPALTANSLNSDGYFFSRVQVCNVDAGVLQDVRNYGAEIAFCRQYPSGKYKPSGAIQKYSDQLRLAAFGYVMDQTASYDTGGRYGGVLRAPMKYVGAKTFDENGIDNTASTGNPAKEWDTTTGVFYDNPDSDTTQAKPISGVINYLNKFGRTGPVPGRYKRFDPVGELHYEVLRYLQGLQPSADAVSGLGTVSALYDGFPLFTSWSDPYGGARTNASDYSCIKSNIVVIGDINTHDGGRLPAASTANNIPDINYWRGIVQAFERNMATTYIDGQGVTRSTANPNGSNGNVPSASRTSQILGSAYWAHTHDIRGAGWTNATAQQRPGLRVKTFLFDVNENGAQNDANTRRYANQFFMAAKYGGFETQPPVSGGNTYNTKGNPFQNEDGANSNDVWQKTTDPGEASTYYLQSSARGVLNAFEDIFSRATTVARNIAGSSTTGRNLVTQPNGLTYQYQGSFDTEHWSGDVYATAISLSNGVLTINPAPIWSAANQLLTRASPETTRTIVVGNDGLTPIPAAMPFTWADLSTNAKAALNRPDSVSAVDSLGARRVDYLRGKRTDEVAVAPATQPVFRPRAQLLGDIVNSGVAYSGKLPNSMNAAGYATFASASASRTAAVYAGSNDGMLHAFDAASGVELFGYIPSWVVPNLPLLTSRTYAANHRSYVDSTPAVAAADLGSSSPDWRTVLVSGTGGGGKGVFALDVTNPASFSASNVLWEFTHEHDIDMGFVVASPQILRFRTSARSATTATYKWFAVVASGINNYVGTNATGTYSDGKPALFLLDLSKPAGTPWVLNTNYYKASVPVDSTLATTTPAGLITFKAEFGAADEVVRIYMGDLHGKLWRLDFGKNDGPSHWNMGELSLFRTVSNCTTGCTAAPLFVAKDASGKVQPISMAPTVAFSGSLRGNYIAVGTGKYLEVLDKTTSGQQSFYVVYDDIDTNNQAIDASSGSVVGGRQWLRAGTVDTSNRTVTVPTFRWGRRTGADVTASTSTYSGWYFDFPDAGERQVFNIVVNGDLLEFNTLFPASTTANVCGSNDGGGNSYAMNMDSGSGGYIRSNVGVLGEAVVFQIAVSEVNRNSSITTSPSDSTGRRIRRTTTKTLAAGSQGLTEVKTTTQEIVTGRLSWRRINNYQDLKNAP
jgi:type IV pilus assembly protein PilY1